MTGAIRLPTPHKGQIAVREQAKRFNWLSSGRRWRKTTMGVSINIELALRGWPLFWGAPTYDQVRIAWNEAKYAAGGVFNFLKSEMTAYAPGGGYIIFRSLDDPDNARGHSFRGATLDETADIKPSAFYEVISPILANYEDSFFWGFGTPKGRNWFFREWQKAQSEPQSMSWQIPTLGCEVVDGKLVRAPHPYENPDFPWSELVREYGSIPERTFQQEYLAQFLEGEGAVFRNIMACMHAPLNAKPDDHIGHRIVAGVDWAKQKDFTAVHIGCLDCKVEVEKDRFNQIDYAFQKERVAALFDKWNVYNGLIELNSIGIPQFEQLQRDGLNVTGFNTTASSKPPLIENLALVLQNEEWQFLPDPICTGELEAYEQKINPVTNRSTYSAPDGMHDDTVIGRALMVECQNRVMEIIHNPIMFTD